jgi:hypothetical protein
MKYPNPHKMIAYDPAGFPRKSIDSQLNGKSSSARGRCGNHPQFEAVVMQEFGNHYTAFCQHCVGVGKRIDLQITERLKNERIHTSQLENVGAGFGHGSSIDLDHRRPACAGQFD